MNKFKDWLLGVLVALIIGLGGFIYTNHNSSTATAMKDLTNSVNTLNVTISKLEERLNSHTNAIQLNVEDIDTNSDNIAINKTDIAVLKSRK